MLRERLRRTQERERVAERRLKDSEEQLHRSQATIVRLKKLVDQRELGARDELSRKLEEEKAQVQEAERKIKVIVFTQKLIKLSSVNLPLNQWKWANNAPCWLKSSTCSTSRL